MSHHTRPALRPGKGDFPASLPASDRPPIDGPALSLGMDPTEGPPPTVGTPPEPGGVGSGVPPRPPKAPPAADGPPDQDPDPEPGPAPGLDPFDPARLRLPADFSPGVRKVVTSIPLTKPKKTWFVRTHPDPGYWLPAAVLELKEERETYLIDPNLREELASEPTYAGQLLIPSINREGVPFVWPIRLPGPDGKLDGWSQSALDAAKLAVRRWVRVTANMAAGGYDIFEALAQAAAPRWPEFGLGEIIKLAFRDKMIDSLDHPVLRRLRGEV